MADLRICAGLSIVETLVVSHLAGISNYSFPKAAFGLLLVQYALVKYYRIFLYPFYFSPLRHLPGPKVCNTGVLSNVELSSKYS